ncbi:hypothetical protein GIB67_015818, partial [Kingdonia uniflora]
MYFVNFMIVLIVYVALVLGKSIPLFEDRASYLILPLEDRAAYSNDKCLIGLQKEEETHIVKYCLEYMRPRDSIQNVVYRRWYIVKSFH